MLRAAGACVTGPAHLQAMQGGQDALALRGWRGGWIAAVADGLGSRTRSAVGSRLAVLAAQQIARQWSPASWLDLSARLGATDLYRRWLALVPWQDKSCAATTLLWLVCDAQGRARVWQLGDGVVLCRLGGRVQVLTPDRAGFRVFLEKVFASQAKEVCEVALLNDRQGPLNVRIMATGSQDGQECRLMMVDITERRQTDSVHEVLHAGEARI